MYRTEDSTRNVTDFREGGSEEGMMGETGRTQAQKERYSKNTKSVQISKELSHCD